MSFTFDDRKNFANSTVLSLSGATLTVALGEGTRFPAAPFNATCVPAGVIPTQDNAEIVRVTGKSGDIFTIVRAQEGTITKAIQAGWVVAAGPTDKFGDDIEAAINAVSRKVDLSLWYPVPLTDPFTAAAASSTVAIVAGADGKVYRSDSGSLWTQSSTPSTTPDYFGAAYGNNQFVVVGGTGTSSGYAMYSNSAAGSTFVVGTGISSGFKNAVAYANSLWVTCGNSGSISTSINGQAWTTRTSGTSNALRGVAFGNSVWVVVGDSGTIRTSADGTTWTSQTSGVGTNLRAVTYGALGFLAVGDGGLVLTSVNGTSWVPHTAYTSATLYAAFYLGTTYYVAGAAGAMFTSTDNVTFSQQIATGLMFTSSFAADIKALAATSTILCFAGSSGAHRYTTIA